MVVHEAETRRDATMMTNMTKGSSVDGVVVREAETMMQPMMTNMMMMIH